VKYLIAAIFTFIGLMCVYVGTIELPHVGQLTVFKWFGLVAFGLAVLALLSKPRLKPHRGFEVKLNAGTTSAEQKKENDHG